MSEAKPEANKVFISWSGPRSRAAAQALRKWLKTVLQATNPWMSERDIDKGTVGVSEILKALEGSRIGIICLTPENLDQQWLNFEAGALLKTPNAESRVCTYLLAGLEQAQVKYPLAMFQSTKAEKEPTRQLIRDINEQLEPGSLDDETLNSVFDKWWPDLEKELSNLPAPTSPVPPERSTAEIATETLELLRTLSPEVLSMSREIAHMRGRRFAEENFWEAAATRGGGSTGGAVLIRPGNLSPWATQTWKVVSTSPSEDVPAKSEAVTTEQKPQKKKKKKKSSKPKS
jgi:hypothetical protein